MKLGLKGQFPPFLSGSPKPMDDDDASFGEADLMELGLDDGVRDIRELEASVARLESDERAMMSEMVSMRRDMSEMNDALKAILTAMAEETAAIDEGTTFDEGSIDVIDLDYYDEDDDDGSIEGSIEDDAPIEELPAMEVVGGSIVDPVPEIVGAPDVSSKEGSHSLMQVQRMLEYEMDRLFVKRISGSCADDEDIAQIDRLFDLFRDLIR